MKRHVLNDEFNDLMEAVDLAQDERTLKQALRTFTAAAGFDRFAYLNVRAGDTRALSNYPAEWQRIYLDNDYATMDPVVKSAKRSMQPFIWSQKMKGCTQPEIVRFFSDAADFGIRSGLSIPVRGSFGRMGMLTLASDRTNADFVEVRNTIHAITAVAFIHVSLNRSVKLDRSGVVLSPREMHCVAWASLGKTMSETAELLGISQRSVRFYLEAAREKLGARNIVHATRLAVEQNLI